MSSPEKISKLLFLYLRRELTKAEAAELEIWRTATPANEALFIKMTDEESVRRLMQEYYHHQERGWDRLVQMAPELDLKPIRRRRRLIRKLAIAASFCLVFGSALYVWMRHATKPIPNIAIGHLPKQKDIPPGSNKAVLTLADGSAILLDSAANGRLAGQGNSTVSKTNDQLIYLAASDPTTTELLYNTLQTPRGGQYQLTLPDGTKVWLNAASTLTYPTSFIGAERSVELTGEAYFEVAKNTVPFRILVNKKMKVEVLGTHFNIMAYTDEPLTATTLLEGKLGITNLSPSSNGTAVLKPGEQASWDESGKIKISTDVDMEENVAWKNGMTSFKDANIKSIMRKVARWYDVDIIYKGEIPERVFGGGIPRNTNLSELLKVLALYNIHFNVEGKKIIVMP